MQDTDENNAVSDCTEPSCKRQINIASKLSETDFVNYIKSVDIFCALETFSNAQLDFNIHFPELGTQVIWSKMPNF